MYNLHKSPEMLAYEQEQAKKKHEADSRSLNRGVLKTLDLAELEIPTLPAATVLLIQLFQDINVDFRKVSKIIQADPGLAVRLLRISNSAYYGQVKQVDSVVRALTVIGMGETKTIVLSYKLMNVIKNFASTEFDFESYWEKSLVMAVLAREIARALGNQKLEEAFLSGLLQDIGVVILRTNKQNEYRRIADAAAVSPDTPLVKLEQQVFGIDHTRIGAEACTVWKFPNIIINAIRQHHSTPQALATGNSASELQATAYAAGQMPDFIIGNKPMQVLDHLMHLKIIDPANLQPLFANAHQSFNQLAEFFDSYIPIDAGAANLMISAVQRLQRMGQAHMQICEPPE